MRENNGIYTFRRVSAAQKHPASIWMRGVGWSFLLGELCGDGDVAGRHLEGVNIGVDTVRIEGGVCRLQKRLARAMREAYGY